DGLLKHARKHRALQIGHVGVVSERSGVRITVHPHPVRRREIALAPSLHLGLSARARAARVPIWARRCVERLSRRSAFLSFLPCRNSAMRLAGALARGERKPLSASTSSTLPSQLSAMERAALRVRGHSPVRMN